MSDKQIHELGKGALPQPKDERDFQASFVLGAAPVDWSKEFRQPEPPNEDQGNSDSCVSQASSYFHWQIHNLLWSRRDLYSRIFLPGGGAYLRDGVAQICGLGQATRDKAPDPSPETEANMRSKAGITAEMERVGIEANYFAVNGKNIDAVAQAIRDAKGCIIGVQGDNAGWQNIVNPKPPVAAEWGHALYCFGYHMHNGVKCIIAKSSWGDAGHTTVHHIKQDYFQSGNTFDGWTLIPKEQQPMPTKFLVNVGGKICVVVIDGFAVGGGAAKSEKALAELKDAFEVPADAPMINM